MLGKLQKGGDDMGGADDSPALKDHPLEEASSPATTGAKESPGVKNSI